MMNSTGMVFRGVKNKADIVVKEPFHCTNDISVKKESVW